MTMFEKLCSERTIIDAWKHIKVKGASGGIDGLSISTFEMDLENNLTEIINDLKSGKWVPLPYLKVVNNTFIIVIVCSFLPGNAVFCG